MISYNPSRRFLVTIVSKNIRIKHMKIINTHKLTEQINRLLRQLELNQEASELYNIYLTDRYDYIDKKMINDIKSDGSSLEEAFYQSFLDVLEINDSDELSAIESSCLFSKVHKLEISDYLSDPYIKKIRPRISKKGEWEIKYNFYEPFEGFIFDGIKIGINYAEISSLGFFSESFPYLEVLHNDKVFMLITPHEINTMKKPIAMCKGKVLALGLGLGYFPYSAALKSDVSEVVVVEKEQAVIDLFTGQIAPLMNTNKIKIIKADAFDYLESLQNTNEYNHIFFDIYHSAEEALPLYLKAKKYANRLTKSQFSFWIEEDIICLIRRYLLTLINESLIGYADSDYKNAQTDEDKMINLFYQLTKEETICDEEKLMDFLSDENIKKLCTKASL